MKYIYGSKKSWITAQSMLVDARQSYKAYRQANKTGTWVIELVKEGEK